MLTKLVAVSVLLAAGLPAQSPTNKTQNDLSWIRSFTVSDGSTGDGQENSLQNEPRMVALLRSSLPQHQFFWRDRGRLTPLPDLVHTFLGVPGKALLAEQRYAVINGCVPHDCDDRGMLWIDTQDATHPLLIFAATDWVNGGDPNGGRPVHLWLFSSSELNWSQLPPEFRSSLSAWWRTSSKGWATYSSERVVLVSLVQPSGQTVSLSPDFFSFSTHSFAATRERHSAVLPPR